MLYRVVDDLAIVDSIFHFLEDYENKINWIILILKVIIRELMMKPSWYISFIKGDWGYPQKENTWYKAIVEMI